MKIGILGTRGIPNHYGGFEQFAEYLSVELVKRGHEVSVYNSSNHPFQKNEFKGVQIIHCKDPEDKIGTVGQFAYDYRCIRDSRKRNFDIILQLGYTSSSIWWRHLPMKKSIVVTNMDGLEWKRSKYSKQVQRFLKHAEKLGAKHSHHLIADSLGIQEHLKKSYGKDSEFIPYGADVFLNPDPNILNEFELQIESYNLLIARLEPENNIETILDGVCLNEKRLPFLVIGNHNTKYGEYLKTKYRSVKEIRFLGALYDQNKLNNLRYFSKLYFHGHSVGGTNPSLLEAMASGALIMAHDNIFNRSVLEENAEYFETAEDVHELLSLENKSNLNGYLEKNKTRIQKVYNWDVIIEQYEMVFLRLFNERSYRQK